jgi:hypothetical protein
MAPKKTMLSPQEKQWISEQRLTRLSDGKECLIYPMGAERYLSSVLLGHKKTSYPLRTEIIGKNVLVIPGYGNSGFLFAQFGAKSVTIYDKDPVTIAWMKAFKKYYHYRGDKSDAHRYPSVGELLTALTRWYPPLSTLPEKKLKHFFLWSVDPKSLRRSYFFYMLSLVQEAIHKKNQEHLEWEKTLQFYAGEMEQLVTHKKQHRFDMAFVPYLLGVRHGIETEQEIVHFIKQITQVVPKGHILVTPSRNTKEFYMIGTRYFATTSHRNITAIPKLGPYRMEEDKRWYTTQGMAIFRALKHQETL